MEQSNYLNLFPTHDSRKGLALRLGLDFDESMQDWEYEISDTKLIPEFIKEYQNSNTSDIERISLMEIILNCLNELLLSEEADKFEKFYPITIKTLKGNTALHKRTLKYWIENDFNIASYLKSSL